MTAQLLLGPAAAGKTQSCLERIHSLAKNNPLSAIWVLLPDRNQAIAFRRRLSETGGALGVRVGTFGDLYTEALALAGVSIPIAPDPVLHRLVQSTLDICVNSDRIQHYAPIQHRPGLALALNDLFGELKRAHISPEQFKKAITGSGRRLEELAELYQSYQSILNQFGWTDSEGLGWLAIIELQAHPVIASSWHFWVDGFDSFTILQLETLALLGERADSLTITLTGEPGMPRSAYRRFKTTLEELQNYLQLTIESVLLSSTRPRPLQQMEAGIFVSGKQKLTSTQHIHFIEAQTQALEAREALRWLKSRIVLDGLSIQSCAVIARDLSVYQPFLYETAREFGLSLYMATGESLITNPAIAAILNILELILLNWARRPLLDAVRTPYFDLTIFGFRPGDLSRLDNVARFGQVLEGLDQWHEALNQLTAKRASHENNSVDDELQLPTLPKGPVAQQLWQALHQFAQHITPPKTATLTQFVTWLEDTLDILHLEEYSHAQSQTAHRDTAALDVFRDILCGLVLTEEILGKERTLPFVEFYTEMQGAISTALYVPQLAERRNAIYAANLSMARGVTYDAVAILGLAEGLFPSPLDEDPFLSDEERFGLYKSGLPLEPRLRSDQQSLFYEAITRAANYLLLTRPYLADDGEIWEPSPYWNAALELFDIVPVRVKAEQKRSLANSASLEEILEFASRQGKLPQAFSSLLEEWEQLQRASSVLLARLESKPSGPYEGSLVGLVDSLSSRYGSTHIWSASRLESYGECGFQFYIGVSLDLEQHKAPQAGYDTTQLGLILHAILERVYQAADSSDPDTIIAVLPTIARGVFDEAPRNLGFRPTPLWVAQQQELLAILEVTIRKLAEQAGDFRIEESERRFDSLILDTSAGPVRLRGVIDRVDRNLDGQIRVIDYKTGSSHLDKRSLIDGRRLQLPLYAAAAEQVLNPGQAVDGLYWSVLRGEAGKLSLSTFDHLDDAGHSFTGVKGALELVVDHIGQSIRSIRSGAFLPTPPEGGCSNYCPAKDFCWRYKPGW